MRENIIDNDKLSVVFFSHSAEWNGSEKSLFDMLMSIKAIVNPIVILPNKGYLSYRLEEAGIQFFIAAYSCHYSQIREKESEQFVNNIEAAFKICKYLSDTKVDIIHSNTSVCDVGAIVAVLLNKPHIWHLREMVKDQFDGQYWNIEEKKALFECTDLFVCNSNTVQNHFAQNYNIRSEVIYNAVTIDESIKGYDNWNDTKCNILFAGGFYERKGIWDALKAIEYLKKQYGIKTKLYIAGKSDNDEEWIVRKYILLHQLQDSVEIIGFQEDLSRWRHNCGISLTCAWKEALGRITIEAMLSKMIPIGADTGGTKEIIGNDETKGFLYTSRDYTDLARAIKRVIEISEQEYEIISQNAREYAKNTFNSNIYVQKITQRYRECHDLYENSSNDNSRYKVFEVFQKRLSGIAISDTLDMNLKIRALWCKTIWNKENIADRILGMGYTSVGIYGMGVYGKRLYDEFIDRGIDVICIKDSNGAVMQEIIPVYFTEENLPRDLLWIITLVKESEKVKERLKQKGIQAITMCDLLG